DGVDCGASTCSSGACCLATSCADMTRGECVAQGGTYGGPGSSCAGGACVPGACCLPMGCEERIEASCTADFGFFEGSGITCASVSNCTGGCCQPVGCTDGSNRFECSNGYQGNGTVCAPDSCPGPCCLVHGCSVLPVALCVAGGGNQTSFSTTCAG